MPLTYLAFSISFICSAMSASFEEGGGPLKGLSVDCGFVGAFKLLSAGPGYRTMGETAIMAKWNGEQAIRRGAWFGLL